MRCEIEIQGINTGTRSLDASESRKQSYDLNQTCTPSNHTRHELKDKTFILLSYTMQRTRPSVTYSCILLVIFYFSTTSGFLDDTRYDGRITKNSTPWSNELTCNAITRTNDYQKLERNGFSNPMSKNFRNHQQTDRRLTGIGSERIQARGESQRLVSASDRREPAVSDTSPVTSRTGNYYNVRENLHEIQIRQRNLLERNLPISSLEREGGERLITNLNTRRESEIRNQLLPQIKQLGKTERRFSRNARVTNQLPERSDIINQHRDNIAPTIRSREERMTLLSRGNFRSEERRMNSVGRRDVTTSTQPQNLRQRNLSGSINIRKEDSVIERGTSRIQERSGESLSQSRQNNRISTDVNNNEIKVRKSVERNRNLRSREEPITRASRMEPQESSRLDRHQESQRAVYFQENRRSLTDQIRNLQNTEREARKVSRNIVDRRSLETQGLNERREENRRSLSDRNRRIVDIRSVETQPLTERREDLQNRVDDRYMIDSSRILDRRALETQRNSIDLENQRIDPTRNIRLQYERTDLGNHRSQEHMMRDSLRAVDRRYLNTMRQSERREDSANRHSTDEQNREVEDRRILDRRTLETQRKVNKDSENRQIDPTQNIRQSEREDSGNRRSQVSPRTVDRRTPNTARQIERMRKVSADRRSTLELNREVEDNRRILNRHILEIQENNKDFENHRIDPTRNIRQSERDDLGNRRSQEYSRTVDRRSVNTRRQSERREDSANHRSIVEQNRDVEDIRILDRRTLEFQRNNKDMENQRIDPTRNIRQSEREYLGNRRSEEYSRTVDRRSLNTVRQSERIREHSVDRRSTDEQNRELEGRRILDRRILESQRINKDSENQRIDSSRNIRQNEMKDLGNRRSQESPLTVDRRYLNTMKQSERREDSANRRSTDEQNREVEDRRILDRRTLETQRKINKDSENRQIDPTQNIRQNEMKDLGNRRSQESPLTVDRRSLNTLRQSERREYIMRRTVDTSRTLDRRALETQRETETRESLENNRSSFDQLRTVLPSREQTSRIASRRTSETHRLNDRKEEINIINRRLQKKDDLGKREISQTISRAAQTERRDVERTDRRSNDQDSRNSRIVRENIRTNNDLLERKATIGFPLSSSTPINKDLLNMSRFSRFVDNKEREVEERRGRESSRFNRKSLSSRRISVRLHNVPQKMETFARFEERGVEMKNRQVVSFDRDSRLSKYTEDLHNKETTRFSIRMNDKVEKRQIDRRLSSLTDHNSRYVPTESIRLTKDDSRNTESGRFSRNDLIKRNDRLDSSFERRSTNDELHNRESVRFSRDGQNTKGEIERNVRDSTRRISQIFLYEHRDYERSDSLRMINRSTRNQQRNFGRIHSSRITNRQFESNNKLDVRLNSLEKRESNRDERIITHQRLVMDRDANRLLYNKSSNGRLTMEYRNVNNSEEISKFNNSRYFINTLILAFVIVQIFSKESKTNGFQDVSKRFTAAIGKVF